MQKVGHNIVWLRAVEERRGESRRIQSSCNGIEDEKVFVVGSS